MDDYGNPIPSRLRRVAGSLDNGATDAEYTPHPERIICAADEQWATHKELDAAIADTCTVIDELEARIVDLETQMAWVHEQLRPHWLTPPNVTEWLAQHNPPFAAAAHPPEGDWAHVPAAEWESICAELEACRTNRAYTDGALAGAGTALDAIAPAIEAMQAELEGLRTFRASVPWEALRTLLLELNPDLVEWEDISTWVRANAPKEGTE